MGYKWGTIDEGSFVPHIGVQMGYIWGTDGVQKKWGTNGVQLFLEGYKWGTNGVQIILDNPRKRDMLCLRKEEPMSFYMPDKSEEDCYDTLNELKQDAMSSSQGIARTDEDLAKMLSSLYIAQQNQMLILWHKLSSLEKKIDALSIEEDDGEWFDRKRFNN